jgi:hypothetical protein
VPGPVEQVRAITVYGGDLVVAGDFVTIGTEFVTRIARWDGVQWHSLAAGLTGRVRALCVHGGDLYAGGDFEYSGGVPVSRVARWDGTTWQALGTGVNQYVNALYSYRGGTSSRLASSLRLAVSPSVASRVGMAQPGHSSDRV